MELAAGSVPGVSLLELSGSAWIAAAHGRADPSDGGLEGAGTQHGRGFLVVKRAEGS